MIVYGDLQTVCTVDCHYFVILLCYWNSAAVT